MKKGKLSEAIAAATIGMAAVSANMAAAELVEAKGFYTVQCTAPAEGYLDQFLDAQARLIDAQEACDFAAIMAVQAELAQIPMVEKWTDTIKNLVTTVGKNNLLDNHLAGSAYTAAWYLMLVDGASTPTYVAGDTAASHAGWTEFTNYAAGTRPAPTFNAASAASKATTATAFVINGAGGTVAGCALISNSTKGGTTGTLYSCGNFTGGNRVVAPGDTLNVTYTAGA